MDLMPPLYLLTGPIGAGKTTYCRQLAESARSRGWRVAGLLSPAWIKAGLKTGILLEDLDSGEQRRLAFSAPTPQSDLRVGKWYFDTQVIAWGQQILSSCPPCDLLIVDELGPLEFNNGQGLSSAFELLSAGQYRVGYVVIRPTLIETACDRWPWAEVLPVAQASLRGLV